MDFKKSKAVSLILGILLVLLLNIGIANAGTVLNPDGSYTFKQIVDENSTAPYYTQPSNGGGFGIYSDLSQDYGWMHDFPDWNNSGLVIQSAKLKIKAWDVDSETFWGWNGEYDGVHVDGTLLNPGYLQGNDYTWSETTFDIPVSSITDDGNMNMFLDIDMHTYGWLTTLDYSELTINYRLDGVANNAPYQPVLSLLPAGGVANNSDLVVNVIGPTPPDADGDSVHYEYRWFVDIGTGGFVDDEFAGRGNHTGNTVPAEDAQVGDTWRVQVIPVDEHGAIGSYTTATWNIVVLNNAPIANNGSVTTNQGIPVTVTLNASDADGNNLTYSIVNGPSNGTLGPVVGNTVMYTPNAGFSGPDTFTFKVNDGSIDSNVATVSVNVAAVTACTNPVLTWLAPLSASTTANINLGDVLPIIFRWGCPTTFNHDETVAIRVRNAASGTLITGFAYGSQITIDDAAEEYRQDFDSSKYNLKPGTKLKVMVYIGNKLKGTSYVNIN